jgi:hypothetical protein
MVKRCGPPSQGWSTFLRNHAPDVAAMDLFVVPTIGFDLLYALVIVRLVRRDLVWIAGGSRIAAERTARGRWMTFTGTFIRKLLWLRKGNENTRGAPAKK